MVAIPYPPIPRISLPHLGTVVIFHGAVLLAVAALSQPRPEAPAPALMVEIVSPAPAPQISQARPAPPERKVQPTPPLPRQRVAPLTTAENSKAEASAPLLRETTPIPSAAQPAPALTQPRFDADYLLNPAPAYPALSRRLGEEGKVLLRVHVEASGRPSQIEIKTGSGSPRLDQAAEEAVWRWKFIPAKRGDETVAAWVQVPIIFSLKS